MSEGGEEFVEHNAIAMLPEIPKEEEAKGVSCVWRSRCRERARTSVGDGEGRRAANPEGAQALRKRAPMWLAVAELA